LFIILLYSFRYLCFYTRLLLTWSVQRDPYQFNVWTFVQL